MQLDTAGALSGEICGLEMRHNTVNRHDFLRTYWAIYPPGPWISPCISLCDPYLSPSVSVFCLSKRLNVASTTVSKGTREGCAVRANAANGSGGGIDMAAKNVVYGGTSVARFLAEAGPYGESTDHGSRMGALLRPKALTWTRARSWTPAGHFNAGDERSSMVGGGFRGHFVRVTTTVSTFSRLPRVCRDESEST